MNRDQLDLFLAEGMVRYFLGNTAAGADVAGRVGLPQLEDSVTRRKEA